MVRAHRVAVVPVAACAAGNSFGAKGVIALVEALKVNITLTDLDVSGAMRVLYFSGCGG